MKGIERVKLDGSDLRVSIVRTRWNSEVVDVLEKRCRQALLDTGLGGNNILSVSVPGAFELPLGAKKIIEDEEVDAVIVLGTLIKGETMHFEYISQAVSSGIMNLGLETCVPVIYGVLNCLSESQAVHRASEGGLDHGYEWGLSAVEMATL